MSVNNTFPSVVADDILHKIPALRKAEQLDVAAWSKLFGQVGLDGPATFEEKYLALNRFADVASRVIGPPSRGMLLAATKGALSSKILNSGWSNILWEVVVDLEPPLVLMLRAVRDARGRLLVDGDSADEFLVNRLAESELVTLTPLEAPQVEVGLRGVAGLVLEMLGI